MTDNWWILFVAALLFAAFIPTILGVAQYVSNKRNQIKTVAALAQIHILVNSNLTEAKRRELTATRVMLASLRELAAFKEQQDVPVSTEAEEAMNIAELRIVELGAEVTHSQDQSDIADAQAEKP